MLREVDAALADAAKVTPEASRAAPAAVSPARSRGSAPTETSAVNDDFRFFYEGSEGARPRAQKQERSFLPASARVEGTSISAGTLEGAAAPKPRRHSSFRRWFKARLSPLPQAATPRDSEYASLDQGPRTPPGSTPQHSRPRPPPPPRRGAVQSLGLFCGCGGE